MDRYGGTFGAHDDAHDDAGPYSYDPADPIAEPPPEPPVSPVGQDERRMQVRAYNHWASLLGNANFPDISDLKPETLADFGPYGVLLDFRDGVEDPAIRFLGDKLAGECGTQTQYQHLSDVPGRSLLSRITDHYLQILANQAPIGFEAEFVNQRGASVLYRGILLPWSGDGETIDFIFGVINWKEMADAATADALLSAIDAALDVPSASHEGNETMDRFLDLSGFPEEEGVQPFLRDDADDDARLTLPKPAFGAPSEDEAAAASAQPLELSDLADEDEEYDEDGGDATEWGAGFSGFGNDDTVYSVDYGDQGLEDGEIDEDVDGVVDPLADESAGLGLAALVSRSNRTKQSVVLPGTPGVTQPVPGFAVPQAYEPEQASEPPFQAPAYAAETIEEVAEDLGGEDETFVLDEAYEAAPAAERPVEPVLELADEAFAELPEESGPSAAYADGEEPEGLYDCLAAARELAQTARSSEDRGRKALYQAVSRAYDFSLEAAANPADFDDLLAENGLTVQDRAPMTPVVKLVFGADYDKTRLTEYASVLGFAHRTGVARGTLDKVLAEAEGGLKGVVQAERRARKLAEGKPVEMAEGVRNAIAKKLRKLEPVALGELAEEGPEFALVMVRRLASGELVALGEVPEDVALVEKAARKLLG